MTENLPEEKSTTVKRSAWARIGLFFSLLAIITLVVGFGIAYIQWMRINQQLSTLSASLTGHDNNSQLTSLQQSVNEMQQTLQKSQALSAEQEKLIGEWRAAQSGDFNQWHVAQAEYLTRMANDQLQFAHNYKLALQLLQQADKTLSSSQDAKLLEIRKAIATDITTLQAIPDIDVTALYVKLTAVDTLLDKLPLQALTSTQQTEVKPASTWQSMLNGLNKIVIIRKTDDSALPLVLPDEKIFLYQNLHAQLATAIWGLLHDNADIYKASLERALAWINQYFDKDAAETKTAIQQLTELQQVNVQPATVTLSNTLQLFDRYQPQVKAGQGVS